MKKGCFICIALMLIFSLPVNGAAVQREKMTNFVSSQSAGPFTLLIPSGWNFSASFINQTAQYHFADGRAFIDVNVLPGGRYSPSEVLHDEYMRLLHIDPYASQVLGSTDAGAMSSLTRVIAVFEYYSPVHRKKTVQRSMIYHNAGLTFLVNVSAPRAVFYKYEELFSQSMGSFRLAGKVPSKPAPKKIIPKEEPAPPVEKKDLPEKSRDAEPAEKTSPEQIVPENQTNEKENPEMETNGKTEGEAGADSTSEDRPPLPIEEENPKKPETNSNDIREERIINGESADTQKDSGK